MNDSITFVSHKKKDVHMKYWAPNVSKHNKGVSLGGQAPKRSNNILYVPEDVIIPTTKFVHFWSTLPETIKLSFYVISIECMLSLLGFEFTGTVNCSILELDSSASVWHSQNTHWQENRNLTLLRDCKAEYVFSININYDYDYNKYIFCFVL